MTQFHEDLSERSKTFLGDLRVYLFSSGKKSEDIDDIVEQLEVHLLEAERNGKPIDKIIGDSPKDYMNQLSSEMTVDVKGWAKYIPFIILGGFSFKIIGDLVNGNLSYSLLELFGFLAIALIFIVTTFASFKFISGRGLSNSQQIMVLFPVVTLHMGLFIGLIYLNRSLETPVIHFGTTGTIIIASLAVILVLLISWWAKTAVLPILLILLFLPEYLLGFSTMQEMTQMTVGLFISYASIAIYIYISFKNTKEESPNH
ncbi:HAAS domain-containing protein [Salipaludibacillus sp. HK11]|uniref:HAAS domain-containing protein n=1 Tax=Salipaludibacillus sp. HK11 TaxID=3394320 RepID=UPI0039FC886A